MLTVRCYRDGRISEEGFDPDQVSDLLEEKDALVWLDIEDPSDSELSLIQEEFALHPLAIEDAQHKHQRPKIEPYESFYFVVVHGLEADTDGLRDHEVHAFVGTNYLITLRYRPAFSLDRVLKRWERQPDLVKEGAGFLLYALLDDVVDGYFDVVDRLEERTEQVEDSVFSEEPPEGIQERIFRVKKQVIEFRRLVMPLREVLTVLQQNAELVTPALQAYYRDVADHVIRALEFIDNLRDLLTTAFEAHLSQVSNRLNIVMKQVTSWAAILLVPTLIAGIYGMNFAFMPELDEPWGYPFALGVMAAASLALYRVFKRREWL